MIDGLRNDTRDDRCTPAQTDASASRLYPSLSQYLCEYVCLCVSVCFRLYLYVSGCLCLSLSVSVCLCTYLSSYDHLRSRHLRLLISVHSKCYYLSLSLFLSASVCILAAPSRHMTIVIVVIFVY